MSLSDYYLVRAERVEEFCDRFGHSSFSKLVVIKLRAGYKGNILGCDGSFSISEWEKLEYLIPLKEVYLDMAPRGSWKVRLVEIRRPGFTFPLRGVKYSRDWRFVDYWNFNLFKYVNGYWWKGKRYDINKS